MGQLTEMTIEKKKVLTMAIEKFDPISVKYKVDFPFCLKIKIKNFPRFRDKNIYCSAFVAQVELHFELFYFNYMALSLF